MFFFRFPDLNDKKNYSILVYQTNVYKGRRGHIRLTHGITLFKTTSHYLSLISLTFSIIILHNFLLPSYFANLANCIAVNSSQEETNAFYYKNHFPNFLWLLRDVHLLPTGSDGKIVSPTEYLVGTVLRRGTSFDPTKSDEVGRAILTFFPSIECKTLQPPSDNPEILRNIAHEQDKLSPVFHREVDQLNGHVVEQLQPKRGFAGNSVDGPLLAS